MFVWVTGMFGWAGHVQGELDHAERRSQVSAPVVVSRRVLRVATGRRCTRARVPHLWWGSESGHPCVGVLKDAVEWWAWGWLDGAGR